MRILIIGGTRLSGPFLVRQLSGMGHAVTIFHRGNHLENVPTGVRQIIAPKESGEGPDRYHLRAFAEGFRALGADVVIHMIAFTREDAEVFVEVFRGIAGRAVVAGSSDVYRVMGIINRTEEGERVPVPIDENGPLRVKPSLHGASSEKKDVEQVVMSERKLPATVLRLPAIYGPGTYRHQEWVRPMLDGRPAIVLGTGAAGFRFSHGYAEDMGWAMALAATNEKAVGRIYNVGESDVPTEGRRLEDFARVAGWKGRIVLVPDEKVPGGDGLPFPGQDWWLETRRIREELGFAEISEYDGGIRATIEWQRKQPNREFDLSAVYGEEDRILASMVGVKR
ncbi:MAG TPA: NAD-dependent epimerase/dehydratase family protein [Tepidisphaeraceae bacterium]|nr:NAD-dependent epimerase/dehydratase family protein [Tepidisphaeraceae bacterium]